jgi:Fe-S oxidoreductase
MKSVLAKTGSKLQEIDSGCCCMAGSFWYEKEHYALSQKIGESILFPAVKGAAPDTAIIACGFSCRHQIEHFTGKKAKHWVEVFEVKDAL